VQAVEIFVERGASVLMIDWDEVAGAELEASVDENGKCIFRKADVSKHDAVQSAIEDAFESFGSIDSLVVSAGIQRYGTALTTDDAQWDEVLGVNLRGAWNAARAALPYIRKQGGSIVNVSSVQALASQQNVSAYTVSKHGLIG
jgi:NAD(P)-dependent dehydrogenase (short-subunit alcohol dehydrogenase family)